MVIFPNISVSCSQKMTSLDAQFCEVLYHFPKRQYLDPSKLRVFADDSFKFDEFGSKFFKRVGNTVGKGEIARYEQFLLFPQCFQKTCLQTCKNQGLFGKGYRTPLETLVWHLSRKPMKEMNSLKKKSNV